MAHAADPLASSPDPLDALPPRVVFFDGVCNFCDGSVNWLLARDSAGRLHFASLQGETAERVRARFPGEFPEDVDTILYLERVAGNLTLEQRAQAIFKICEELGRPWAHVAKLRALPPWLTRLGYRLFAANRYRLFGRMDACRVPSPEDRERLLP